jgi:cell division protein FtsA
MGELVVGIDIGTTKVCTIVGEVRDDDTYIVGVGIEPTNGMKKGMVTDVNALAASISSSVHKAERSSGYDIGRAFVSVSAKHVQSMNSKGMVPLSGNRPVEMADIIQALENARAIPIPHGREILHVIPRRYNLDDQEGVHNPINMYGYRLEVEAHIITAASAALENLEKSVEAAGVYVDRFILNPLASGDVVLTNTERESGVMVVDIGGGTTDVAIFIEGTVWHTAVVSVGGYHVTNDIAHVMNLPHELAEAVKLEFGHADPRAVQPLEMFPVQPFGEEHISQVKRSDLVDVIHARISELFELVLVEVKRSGYEGLLPAGVVLTGGASVLPGMKAIANRVMQMPARVAQPEAITGMADPLRSPAYSTSVGLLRLGLIMDVEDDRRDKLRKPDSRRRSRASGEQITAGLVKGLGGIFRRFVPNIDDEN